MDKKLVSAIITTYGRSFNEILKSIDSVQKQTYKNIELIVVDDNEPSSYYRQDLDKNIKKFNKTANIKINYIKHKKNFGAQVARNTGIYNSNGELLAFLDDDDEWLSEKIEKQVKLYNDDETVGLIYCKGYQIEEETGKTNEYYNATKFKNEFTFNELLYSDRIGTTTQAMITRKAIYSVGNFDESQPARQDYEMWIRISKKFRCIGVDDFLFNHYIHDGEQISKNHKKAIIGYKNIYKKNFYYYRKNIPATLHYYRMIISRYKKIIGL